MWFSVPLHLNGVILDAGIIAESAVESSLFANFDGVGIGIGESGVDRFAPFVIKRHYDLGQADPVVAVVEHSACDVIKAGVVFIRPTFFDYKM